MSWWMRVKIAVLAPIPRAKDRTDTARKTGDLPRMRREYRKSRSMPAIMFILSCAKKVPQVERKIRPQTSPPESGGGRLPVFSITH
jgi:hypothetical protein